MFPSLLRASGSNWYDTFLPERVSELFIHVDGDQFNIYDAMWLAKYEPMPASRDEARSRFNIPSSNPASHAHVFYFDIP